MTQAQPQAKKPAWISTLDHWTAAKEKARLKKMLDKKAAEESADPLADMAKAVQQVEKDLREENAALKAEVASLNTHYGWAVKKIDELNVRLLALEGHKLPEVK